MGDVLRELPETGRSLLFVLETKSASGVDQSQQFFKPVYVEICRMRSAVVCSKSKIYNHGGHSYVARRLNVYFRIANHRSFARRGIELVQNLACAKRIGF